MKKTLFVFVIMIGLMLPDTLEAQCAMCRAALESSGDIKAAEGINNGIVYLMALPYILVAGLFYFVYRKMKNRPTEEV
ncbi:hypothetical protein [Zobellia uliginosa]|uniref:hypothetical protein n=1 Tax=Zobellia uliginosa TaxID=143224 RepID=UPI0026E16A8F|nr:hypothetical protein [Zobellia uliginosa]MDO6517482.1 hypothetical protein [Zobellia uliginosa]